MESSYLYLILNVGAISIPLIASFYSRAPFYKVWKHLPLAIGVPALLFILWDMAFTSMGIWGFNPVYLTGIKIINLPLEEVLFFICIPYACLFSYFAFENLIKKDVFGSYASHITVLFIILSVGLGILFIDRWYTATTFISFAVFLLIHLFFLKTGYLGRFYFTYLFILIPFFIINGILTGSFIEEQVVWYNDSENMDLRIGTIPFEDAFYGMFLILMNVTLFEYSRKKSQKNHQV